MSKIWNNKYLLGGIAGACFFNFFFFFTGLIIIDMTKASFVRWQPALIIMLISIVIGGTCMTRAVDL